MVCSATITTSASQGAPYGPIYNDSLGAVGIWKPGLFHTLIAVALILTVIRHTRAEEESARAELLESTVVGRSANLSATLLLAFGASIATGLVATGSLLSTPVPASGSVAFGLVLASSGIVFASVAAVAAQLCYTARAARLRICAACGRRRWRWEVVVALATGLVAARPYAGERWWVLLLHVTSPLALVLTAYLLLRARDFGAGLIADRPGPPTASAALAGPFGLAWRLQRGALLAWTVGLCLYGLLIGNIVAGIGDEIGSNPTIREIVTRMGGSPAIENSFIAVGFSVLAVVAAAVVASRPRFGCISRRMHSAARS